MLPALLNALNQFFAQNRFVEHRLGNSESPGLGLLPLLAVLIKRYSRIGECLRIVCYCAAPR